MLHELGIRTHKTLLDHIRQQVFNTMGGVQLTYDLTAYDKIFALLSVRSAAGGSFFPHFFASDPSAAPLSRTPLWLS